MPEDDPRFETPFERRWRETWFDDVPPAGRRAVERWQREYSGRADLPASPEQRFESGTETPEKFFARRDAERLRAREEWEVRPYDAVGHGGGTFGQLSGSHSVVGRTRRNARLGFAGVLGTLALVVGLLVLVALGVVR